MKSYLFTPFGICLILGNIALLIAVSWIGFSQDSRGFLGNLLAEIVGMCASVLIALLIVERFVKYRRQQQWAKVRKLTYETIAAHLCDLVTDIFIYFPVKDQRPMTPIIEGRECPNLETIAAMDTLAHQLRSLPTTVNQDKSTSDLAVEYYKDVKWDLDQIRDVLTPRVVQSSDDQEIINALIEFDRSRRRLNNAIITHKRVITHSVFPDVIGLLE